MSQNLQDRNEFQKSDFMERILESEDADIQAKVTDEAYNFKEILEQKKIDKFLNQLVKKND